jgi:DNA-binding MarR family transcriptional regulator
MTELLSESATLAWARLVRAQQKALGGVEAELKRGGFPPLVWYDILLELDRSPEGALRHRDIERRMLLQRYSVTRIVERMEQEGLIERAPCPDDGRGAMAAITKEGRALRGRMWPAYAAAIRRHFADCFTEKELAVLGDYLGRLSAAVRTRSK